MGPLEIHRSRDIVYAFYDLLAFTIIYQYSPNFRVAFGPTIQLIRNLVFTIQIYLFLQR